MSGHNTAFELGQPQTGTSLDGGMILIKNGVPSDGVSGDTGFGKGAIGINTAGDNDGVNSNFLYVNTGTSASPVWQAVFINT